MTESQTNQRLGPYELAELLGEGGMAAVYRAYQPSVDRFVAVKVIRRWIGDDPTSLERFQREARVIARLEHPNILPVYDYNGTHHPPYIVMRLMQRTVEDLLRGGPMSVASALRVMQQVSGALDYAHAQGIIHRDIKPSNIMLDEQGNAYLADFGLAKPVSGDLRLTQDGSMMGTPGYMAPEQGMGIKEITPAVDIYALGAVLFEMLTGQPAYQADTPFSLLMKQIQEAPPDAQAILAELPKALNPVLHKAMAHAPSDRYATAMEMTRAAAEALGLSTIEVARPSPATSVSRAETSKKPKPDSQPTELNKQVTVLYAEASEYEQDLAASQDTEGVLEAMTMLWGMVDRVLVSPAVQGGLVVSRTEKSFSLIWGAEAAREDDPERAIRAALALCDALQPITINGLIPLQIGLNTGMVQLKLLEPGSMAGHHSPCYTAAGPALIVAARLPAALPDGGVAITQDTYRLVQGVFDVTPLPPLRGRGAREVLTVHQVLRAKPRSLRTPPRGVEGVDTQMIGRSAELLQLQEALEAALDGEAQMVTVVGEAGLGKSRLLYSLFQWIELRPEILRIFRGRSNPDMTAQPYSLLREVLAFRFEIQDNDAPTVVQQKLEQGVQDFMGLGNLDCAHFVGHLAGYDFSTSPYLQDALNDPEFFKLQAQAHCLRLFKAAAGGQDTDGALIELEDVQWADDASLDLFLRLLHANPDSELMLVFTGRPALLKRRPDWGKGIAHARRIDLQPLSRREARKLAGEILQKIGELPDDLRDWLVERSEGNPLYMEELVKMLVELRVIVKDETAWQVFPDRVSSAGLPATLTGVLQARLDGLSPDERVVLQRAAAIGRVFWEGALAALECADELPIDVPSVLETLLAREFIKEHEGVSLGGARPYGFSSSLLRDVAYETVLKRVRREYHRAAAEWLLKAAGERQAEYAAAVAGHWERAGEARLAAESWLSIGRQGVAVSAYPEALTALHRALTQNEALGDAGQRIAILNEIAEIYSMTGRYALAQETLEDAIRLGRECHEAPGLAHALSAIGRIMYWMGSYPEGLDYIREAETLARQTGDRPTLIFTLRQQGNLLFTTGDLDKAQASMQESLVLALESGDSTSTALAYSSLAMNVMGQGNYERAVDYLRAGLSLDPKDKSLQGLLYGNLSCAYIELANWKDAESSAQDCLVASRQIGNIQGEVEAVENLGICLLEQGKVEEARQRFLWTLNNCFERQVLPHILDYLPDYAHLLGRTGQVAEALPLLGLSLSHPVSQPFTIQKAKKILTRLKAGPALEMSDVEIQASLDRGATLDVNTVVQEILSHYTSN